MLRLVLIIAALALLSGCATRHSLGTDAHDLDSSSLPPDDVVLVIPQLTPCTDGPNHALHLKRSEPITVLVHGCFGSSGEFRGLAQVFASHGQKTVCFTYDDRANLSESARQLRRAIDLLVAQTKSPLITVIGHSQGALVAHKSLTDLNFLPPRRDTELRLVTISGPFGGIASAKTCGKHWLFPVTLGLLPLSCLVVTGEKWSDITYSSRFIRQPGALIPEVSSFLKIDTDERGSCRRRSAERCTQNDEVFSLAEQRNGYIEGDRRARRVQVSAGHTEIVGDQHAAPKKLIAILQDEGEILPTGG